LRLQMPSREICPGSQPAKCRAGRRRTRRTRGGVARLTETGVPRSSFVPPPKIRALRVYTRHVWDLTADRTRYWQRLEAGCKLSAVVPELAGHQTTARKEKTGEPANAIVGAAGHTASVQRPIASRSSDLSAGEELVSAIGMPTGHRQQAETPSKQVPRCGETAPAAP
jgi:hypothetical protein